jgi:hypothetical protein
MKEWWVERRNKAKEDRARLIKIRRELIILSQISYGYLSAEAIYYTDDDPVFKNKLKSYIDEYRIKWAKADEFILDNEPYLPQEVRLLYKEYKVKMGKAMVQIVQGPITKEFIVSMYDEIDPCIDKVVDKIDYHLGLSVS